MLVTGETLTSAESRGTVKSSKSRKFSSDCHLQSRNVIIVVGGNCGGGQSSALSVPDKRQKNHGGCGAAGQSRWAAIYSKPLPISVARLIASSLHVRSHLQSLMFCCSVIAALAHDDVCIFLLVILHASDRYNPSPFHDLDISRQTDPFGSTKKCFFRKAKIETR